MRSLVGRRQRRRPAGDSLVLHKPVKGKYMHVSSESADASKTPTRLSFHLIFEFDGMTIGAGVALVAGIATIIGVVTQLI
jgi:hypothetical protein